ncbi:voltage-dependent calcium channel type D subunit alpha-1-like [Tropilaelaps mercedesae]|uniref:Voltage-dependent calcium channel type D subunit alpha-1-like n=1 Tax=Tropilaelaps mercedesae TaxID=418985 RepID=A0A1V9X1J7_9ACAR|nr:voltage-dependent calcium channel type D subunit alpha-1-like [Tropilaelaps mercedesae]
MRGVPSGTGPRPSYSNPPQHHFVSGHSYIALTSLNVLTVLQGLGKYCDPDFVRATQRELAEAFNLTQEQMDRAAHEILQAESRRHSTPSGHSGQPNPTNSTQL